MTHPIDPVRLQRLVDGELGLDETQGLLRTAETHPGSWRQMATTFVENRVWQNSFVETNGSVDSVPETLESRSQAQTQSHLALVDTESSGTFGRTTLRWWLSMAAGVMLALSIGFTAGQWQNDSDSIGPGVALQNSEDTGMADKTPGLNQIVYRPDYQMHLEDTQGNQLLDSAIPLYDARRAEKLGLTLRPRVVSDEVLQSVRNSGYQLNQDVRYVSGRLNDGRQVVVPIRKTEFVPGQ